MLCKSFACVWTRVLGTYWLDICGCCQRLLTSTSSLLEANSLVQATCLACGFASMLIRIDHVRYHVLVRVALQHTSVRDFIVLTSANVALIRCADVFLVGCGVRSSSIMTGGQSSDYLLLTKLRGSLPAGRPKQQRLLHALFISQAAVKPRCKVCMRADPANLPKCSPYLAADLDTS